MVMLTHYNRILTSGQHFFDIFEEIPEISLVKLLQKLKKGIGALENQSSSSSSSRAQMGLVSFLITDLYCQESISAGVGWKLFW